MAPTSTQVHGEEGTKNGQGSPGIVDDCSVYLAEIMKDLRKTTSNAAPSEKCKKYQSEIPYKIEQHEGTVLGNKTTLAQSAENLVPADTGRDCIMYPASVQPDGNCLSTYGSMFASDTEDRHEEL